MEELLGHEAAGLGPQPLLERAALEVLLGHDWSKMGVRSEFFYEESVG